MSLHSSAMSLPSGLLSSVSLCVTFLGMAMLQATRGKWCLGPSSPERDLHPHGLPMRLCATLCP